MNASEAIWDVLKSYTDTVFLVPGGGAMFLVDALGRSGLRYIPCLHEQGAGFAALGYAMQRKGLGVCLTTSGPGATNALTPCAAAWMDSIPVLFISGQVPTEQIASGGLRSKGIQEVDIILTVGRLVKFAGQLASGKDIHLALHEIAKLCLDSRPGPCWLDVPLDVQAQDV